MFQRPVLRSIIPTLRCVGSIGQTRNFRPTVKMGPEIFEIKIDVKQFTAAEIRVKACPDYIIIEGSQERKLESGYIERKFIRKFRMPSDCNPACLESELNNDGILTIVAPRNTGGPGAACETLVPIKGPEQEKMQDGIIKVEGCMGQKDPCDTHVKAKTQDNSCGNKPPHNSGPPGFGCQ